MSETSVVNGEDMSMLEVTRRNAPVTQGSPALRDSACIAMDLTSNQIQIPTTRIDLQLMTSRPSGSSASDLKAPVDSKVW